MHKYLPAIGFHDVRTSKDIRPILDACLHYPETSTLVKTEEGSFGYLSKSYGDNLGLRLYVEYETGKPLRENYYFPYADSSLVSTRSYCVVEQLAERNAYSGMTEESNLGLSLIFYISNGMEYARRLQNGTAHIDAICLTGLSVSGKILLPLKKTQKQEAFVNSSSDKRAKLLAAAKNGDPTAMEKLAVSDMKLTQSISEHLYTDDLYTLVDTCFMPCGLESDCYTIIGQIQRLEMIHNTMTGEELCRMIIECNSLHLMVMINRKDLLGEPAVGRRFKGDIWIQGKLLFS